MPARITSISLTYIKLKTKGAVMYILLALLVLLNLSAGNAIGGMPSTCLGTN